MSHTVSARQAGTASRAPFQHRRGRDCATSAFQNLLGSQGLQLSEAGVFGLGEGLAFWYCDVVNGFPVLLGQNSYLEYTLCERLGARLLVHEPDQAPRLREDAALARVARGMPTIVKADCYHLDHCWRDDPDEPRQHFGEHVLLVAAVEDGHALVSDIFSDRLERIPLDALARARAATEGYELLLPRRRWYELDTPPAWPDPRKLVRSALLATGTKLIESRGKFGVSGMRHAAQALPEWLLGGDAAMRPQMAFTLDIMARRMDEGALGSCFRGLFFEFLTESAQGLDDAGLAAVATTYAGPVLALWRGIIGDLRTIAQGPEFYRGCDALDSLSERLVRVAQLEEDMGACLIKLCRT
jgi:hypothetical protein